MTTEYNQMRTRAGDGVLVVLFLATLFVPFFAQILDFDPGADLDENRVKSASPELALTRKSIEAYPSEYDRFYRDNFGLRSSLVRFHHMAMLRGFSSPPKAGALIGQNNWLFLREAVRKERIPISDSDLHKILSILENYRTWVEARGARFLVVVVPNKHTIYPEFLPWRAKLPDGDSRLTKLIEYSKEVDSSLEIADLRAALLVEKNASQLYYRTDSHWAHAAQRIAFREIVDRVAPWFRVQEGVHEPVLTSSKREHEGDIAMIFTIPGVYTEAREFYRIAAPRAKVLSRIETGAHHGRELKTKVDDAHLPGLVLIHDSFFATHRLISQLMAESFQQFHAVQYAQGNEMKSTVAKMETLVMEESPQLVILEIIERNIHMISYWPRLQNVSDEKEIEEKLKN